jgi:hypothetical protein
MYYPDFFLKDEIADFYGFNNSISSIQPRNSPQIKLFLREIIPYLREIHVHEIFIIEQQ